jgi:hypothetical protein
MKMLFVPRSGHSAIQNIEQIAGNFFRFRNSFFSKENSSVIKLS